MARKASAKQVDSDFCPTIRDLSRRFGDVQERTLHAWAREGAPAKTKNGYSFEEWSEWRRQNKFKRRARTNSVADPRTRIELAEAKIKELKAEQLAGALVNKAGIIRLWMKYVSNARQILLTLPEAIAMLIPDGEMRNLVRKEVARIVNDVLRELEEAGKDVSAKESGKVKQ